jgi:hypothetical protein
MQMQVNAHRDAPKRNKHSTKAGPGRRHAQGDGTKKTAKQKSAGLYGVGILQPQRQRNQLRMAKQMNRLTDQERANAFRGWYEAQGHWVYDGRADAVRTWRERGINGRPGYTSGAEALLADWIAADWMKSLKVPA